MSQKTETKIQSYPDGLAEIYSVQDVSQPGEMPHEKLVCPLKLRFEERTVGINRYYAAMSEQIRIERLIRCPRLQSVVTQNVVLLSGGNGVQYRIKQIQYPAGVFPLSMDLSLERITENYEFAEYQENSGCFIADGDSGASLRSAEKIKSTLSGMGGGGG